MTLENLLPYSLYLLGIIILGLTFKNLLKVNTSKQSLTEFLEEEHSAQFVKSKCIDAQDFIHINFDLIPKVNRQECQLLYQDILSYGQKSMLNLKEQSNLDLKKKYGAKSIEQIASYERNYFECMNLLVQYARLLFELDYILEAKHILELCIQYDCDLSKAYLLLIQIYKSENNEEALFSLKPIIQDKMKHSPFLPQVLAAF